MANHFVYIYKGSRGEIHYVGYGKEDVRAVSHQSKTHNSELAKLIKTNKFSLEIAGPFEDERMARAVESALISAIDPFCNKKQEKKEWRFRPIGVTPSLAERPTERPLNRKDFLGSEGTTLFVRISAKDFADRKGYSLSSPPSDKAVMERVQKYWQLGRYLPDWIESPEASPSLLIGVTGSPGSQMVIASMEIDTTQWDNLEIGKGGLIQIPLKDQSELDALNLRGRRIDIAAGLKFGGFRSEFYKILKRNYQFL
ncbi:hypothetical protein L1D40_09445 [Shewanella insulae]|uniref:hypothetical protein n=1 Tax=Shewanella insulae TaxID=2681496 RepID=UPI001EFE3156|nr:hypothetical protein [Shewanella insulae]MCG9755436.1 hypothetical protein [Shewanella insulae]